MSYIPPHMRVSHDNKPKTATPAVSEQTKIMRYIPPSLRHLSHHASTPASSSTQHPRLGIRSSFDVIYRFIVLLPTQHLSCQHVKFTRFEGDTYTHLQNFQLYTLTPDLDHPGQQQNSTEIIEQEQIQRNPVDAIIKAWKEDLKEVLEKFGRIAQGESRDRVLPVILLRFGRNLFHNRRGFFHWDGSHTPENLESNIKTRRLFKTFNGYLSREEFVFLRDLACKGAEQIQSDKKLIIEVEDNMRPGQNLLCTCLVRFKESVNSGKMDDLSENTDCVKPVLESIQVMFLPVRHMMGDVACVGKSCDIRLAFIVEEYPPPLSETELCDIKSCFSSSDVIMGETTLSVNRHSTSGRFKAVGCSYGVTKVVTGGGLKWYFEFSPKSHQAFVEPIICQEFCQGHKEWDTEKAILCIEELLQRLWADSII